MLRSLMAHSIELKLLHHCDGIFLFIFVSRLSLPQIPRYHKILNHFPWACLLFHAHILLSIANSGILCYLEQSRCDFPWPFYVINSVSTITVIMALVGREN